MNEGKSRVLYALIAVLVGLITGMTAGILKSIDGGTVASAFLFGGGAFVTSVTTVLALMTVVGLFESTKG
ncbi:hypothetical protein [Actinomadura terrae]|uniref:hypothetical protein n=1 Tax=Actinomadura terrae TaxID=604353 RepID=UPI001FA6BFD8|nr:hypothetical protein [Actinomadura terrae]